MKFIYNFIFGAYGIGRGIEDSILFLIHQPLLWGFAIGFLLASILHSLLICEHPKHYLHVIVSSNEKSFKTMCPPALNGSYKVSYFYYSKIANGIKIFFSLSMLIFIFIIFLSLLRF